MPKLINLAEVPDGLDVLSKLLDLHDLGEITLSPADLTFLESLQSNDFGNNKDKLERLWAKYVKT